MIIVNTIDKTTPPPHTGDMQSVNGSASSVDVEALCWQLRRAFRELGALADRVLQPSGMTAGDRALLEFLVRSGKPVSISELARTMSVSRQHIHQALRRLPDARWIEASADPGDARAVLLQLTAAGRAAWKRVRRHDEAVLAKLAAVLPTRDVRNATATLQALRESIAALERDDDAG